MTPQRIPNPIRLRNYAEKHGKRFLRAGSGVILEVLERKARHGMPGLERIREGVCGSEPHTWEIILPQ